MAIIDIADESLIGVIRKGQAGLEFIFADVNAVEARPIDRGAGLAGEVVRLRVAVHSLISRGGRQVIRQRVVGRRNFGR